jgi:acyl-CoA thioesterase II
MLHTPWNELDIGQLLSLDPIAPCQWRTRHGDANRNARSYGGQLLGQAMMAGLMDMPADRAPTMMQFLFLQGALPQEPVLLQVTQLQDGKRFSSNNVRGRQANGRIVLDAQVSGAVAMEAPTHTTRTTAPKGEQPEKLALLNDLSPVLKRRIEQLGGYSLDSKPSIEFRIPDAERQLSPGSMDGRFRFWMRAVQPLVDNRRLHAAAFAYLSDWWLNFSALGLHLRDLGERQLYIASLNHAIWLHRPVRADQWLHVESTSPASAGGRGFSIGTVHDLNGVALATITQDCLMAYAN